MKFTDVIFALDKIPHKHLSMVRNNDDIVIYFEPTNNFEIDLDECKVEKINNLYKISFKE